MSDLGWIGKEGTERMRFFNKSKIVMEFLHDLRKFISNQTDLEIIEKTLDIITDIGNKLMNQDSSSLKKGEK